ncbi:MAG: LysR substrate-binding domain-containing protein [Pseudomonadota bacterium]
MLIVNLPSDLLRTFVTVIDLGGYTRAAQVLGRSQPAISLQMQRLEGLIGTKLVIRSGREITLTEGGQALAQYARQILRLNDEAVAYFTDPTAIGILRVGLPTDFSVEFLQEALSAFAAEHQDVLLEVHCGLSRELLERLQRDQLDIIVALSNDGENQYLVRSWRESPIWVSGEQAEAHRKSPVPLAAHPDGCEYRERMISALGRCQRDWRIAFTSPGISALQRAVRAGLGVTALTRKTLLDDMRVLGEADGYPALEDIHIGLFYKHARLSDAGLMLVNRLINNLDKAAEREGSG